MNSRELDKLRRDCHTALPGYRQQDAALNLLSEELSQKSIAESITY